MIELTLTALAAMGLGVLIGRLTLRGKLSALTAKMEMLDEHSRSEKEMLKSQYEQLLTRERELRTTELESLKEAHDRQTDDLKEAQLQQVNELKEAQLQQVNELKEQINTERAYAARLREESDRQWAQKLETLKNELQKTAADQLADKQASLQENNRSLMDQLLSPLKEQFADFKRSVDESKTQNEVSKKELQQSFESTLKLFRQEQEQTVNSLKEQTGRIGADAANLTKALKGDSKMQGDWGEMVLESILESSGLRRDEEYFVQANVKDADGNNLRPDVLVRFPEGRQVIIDSKVSLTAYADAVAAADDATRDRLLKEHARSVRKHVDELAEKNYAQIVDNAIGFVLMFVPNENSYIAAMKQQPDLSRYAYAKHIIIISPSNLLMALQLAYNLWQYDRQNKNVELIVKSAADLYDKVAGFADTFADVETQLMRLTHTLGKAKTQLYDGTGNVMRRIENLKAMGVTPKKQIKQLADATTDE